MNTQVKLITQGEPYKDFLIKVALLSVIFPLHHIIEKRVTNHLIENKLMINTKTFSFRRTLASLWPWLSKNKREAVQS